MAKLDSKLDYAALNSTLRYLMFSVFSVRPGVLGPERSDARKEAIDDAFTFFKLQEERGVVVRGLYDVAGLRADADFMIWTHAERVEALQATYADFRRTTTWAAPARPVWSSVALHRPAEFNKSHIPAFLAGEEPGAYICVYPVRAVLRVVPAARRGTPPHARRARHGRPRVQGRARQHRAGVRAG